MIWARQASQKRASFRSLIASFRISYGNMSSLSGCWTDSEWLRHIGVRTPSIRKQLCLSAARRWSSKTRLVSKKPYVSFRSRFPIEIGSILSIGQCYPLNCSDCFHREIHYQWEEEAYVSHTFARCIFAHSPRCLSRGWKRSDWWVSHRSLCGRPPFLNRSTCPRLVWRICR